MDPSPALCLIVDGFSTASITIPSFPWYTGTPSPTPVLTPNHSPLTNPSPPLFGDINKYNVLQKVKEMYTNPRFVSARDMTNPFEAIHPSIFNNRSGLKLANIDAVHHMSSHVSTPNSMQSISDFTFCDVAAGPGSFTQYLQYRYSLGIGYGMTLKIPNLDWNTRSIDMKRFTPYYGPNNTGNLYHNWKSFIIFVTDKHPSGVDLVTADGGFDFDEIVDKTTVNRQETITSRLLLTEVLIGLGCAKLGGNFIVKVFDTLTTISAQLVFILSQCFEDILIFKPVTSQPTSAERYILCKRRRDNIQGWFQLMSSAADMYDETSFITSLFSETLPVEFVKWLTELNNLSIDNQLRTGQNILKVLKGQSVSIPEYNIPKFLTIWNLPDRPIPTNSALKLYKV
jgi:23S rRNA U2552 (ribose-2'-O)-methylase RlmE/FtsJ